jgi:hypothetical protein
LFLQNERSSSIEQARNQIHEMKIELVLDNTYNQPTDNNQALNLIDGPVHLIELSKTNVQHLLTIANEVCVYTYVQQLFLFLFK